jgi:hypothetical protein
MHHFLYLRLGFVILGHLMKMHMAIGLVIVDAQYLLTVQMLAFPSL